MRILAGLDDTEADYEARALFAEALRELGVPAIDERDAVARLARATAAEIVSGTMPAQAGAERIWNLTLAADAGHFPELDTFVYAASEWRDRPEDAQIFEAGILAAARDLLR